MSTKSFNLRCELMILVRDTIEKNKMSQAEAAKVCGVYQSRISDLTNGKVELFSLAALVNFCDNLGLEVRLVVCDKSTGRQPYVPDYQVKS